MDVRVRLDRTQVSQPSQFLDRITRWEAIVQAAPQRLRPLLMTTITTVLGMLPLAMGIGAGSEFLQPLGITIFSGLTLATLLTLFLIPCLYVLLHDWLRWPFGRSPWAIAPRPAELSDDDAIADPHEGDPAPIPVETSELPSAGDRR